MYKNTNGDFFSSEYVSFETNDTLICCMSAQIIM